MAIIYSNTFVHYLIRINSILLSASSEIKEIEKGLKKCAHDYIVNPFSGGEILLK
jgi:DNA-binding response OmpR family regulator